MTSPTVYVNDAFDDEVYCGRCGHWVGPEGSPVWVAEVVICEDCVTDDEKRVAVRPR